MKMVTVYFENCPHNTYTFKHKKAEFLHDCEASFKIAIKPTNVVLFKMVRSQLHSHIVGLFGIHLSAEHSY